MIQERPTENTKAAEATAGVFDSDDTVETKLLHIFGLVNDWLRFAETKNGALLAFCSACIFGLLKLPSGWSSISPMKYGLLAAVACLGLAALVSIWSFFPQIKRLKISLWPETDECKETDNLIYFGDICKYSAEDLFDRVCERYSIPFDYLPHRRQYLHDIANQIIVNSKITMRKFRLFQRALRLVLACFPVFIITWGIAALIQHCFPTGT